MALKNAVDERIKVYCILDRDFHTDEEIAERYEQARKMHVELHVWEKKELENYLLIPEALQRVVAAGIQDPNLAPSVEELRDALGGISDRFYEKTLDALATEFYSRHRAGNVAGANRAARQRLSDTWDTLETRLGVVSGKDVLSAISNWSQVEFGVSISSPAIARELRQGEISNEVLTVVRAIEEGASLAPVQEACLQAEVNA
jgi:hypothetical protein